MQKLYLSYEHVRCYKDIYICSNEEIWKVDLATKARFVSIFDTLTVYNNKFEIIASNLNGINDIDFGDNYEGNVKGTTTKVYFDSSGKYIDK